MPRQPATQMSLLGAPSPMGAEGPSLMTVGTSPPLTLYQGDDKRWLFQLTKTGGAPFDLTDYTAAMQFRLAVADTAPTGEVTPDVEVRTPATGGEIMVTLLSELSTTMDQPSYMWDLQITHTPTNWTTTIAAGTLTVTKEVTRLP